MAAVSTVTRNADAKKLDTTLANFDESNFESRLESLKDTQDGIQGMSTWCLAQRKHHKKIVSSWLNVFKRVGVEHRLTLFYLANDVIQYSKRKRYEFVEAWATALQRATTMVRDAKVKSKILRIFKIWEQRGIYNEEFISDLSGLLNMTPPKRSDNFADNEYQNAKLVASIRECCTLAEETDKCFKKLPKPLDVDIEDIKQQLKDKTHAHSLPEDITGNLMQLRQFSKTLEAEIKSRNNVRMLLVNAMNYYAEQREEVKVVVTAYKNFGNRIKLVKKKCDELLPTLSSPVPSPDINAPSPEREAELKLPDEDNYVCTPLLSSEMSYGNNSYVPDFGGYQGMKKANQSIELTSSRSDDENYAPNINNDLAMGAGFYKPEPVGLGLGTYAEDINIPGLNALPVPPPQSEYTSLARAAQQYGAGDYLSTYRADDAYNSSNDYANNNNNDHMGGIGEWSTVGNSVNNAEPRGHNNINFNNSTGLEKNLSINDLTSVLNGARGKPVNQEVPRLVDIDHRNLISLTGSPSTNDIDKNLPWPTTLNEESHQTLLTGDIDYRFPMNEKPTPQNKTHPPTISEHLEPQIETKNMVVDMELSDDDLEENNVEPNVVSLTGEHLNNSENGQQQQQHEGLLETPGSPQFGIWDNINPNMNAGMESSAPPPPPPPPHIQEEMPVEGQHWPMNQWNNNGMGHKVDASIPPPPCPPPPPHFAPFVVGPHMNPTFPPADYTDGPGCYGGPNNNHINNNNNNMNNGNNNMHQNNNNNHRGGWMRPPLPPHHSPRNYGPRGPMRGNPFFGRGGPNNGPPMGRGVNNQYRKQFRGKPSWI